METLELFLYRKYFQITYTIGKLFWDKVFFCDTLEDKVRDLKDLNKDGDFDEPGEGKIYGETAIPYGRYRVMVTYSPKLKRRLPILLGVPGYTGIRMHRGITDKNSLGCILVGENKIKGGLINGKDWEEKLIKLLDEAIMKQGKEVYITIKKG